MNLHRSAFVALLLPLLSTAVAGQADTSKPVQVFLIMGQSNTLEMGKVKGAAGSLEHAVKEEGLYPFLVDDKGTWTKREDVRNVHVMGSGGGLRPLVFAQPVSKQSARGWWIEGDGAKKSRSLAGGRSFRRSCASIVLGSQNLQRGRASHRSDHAENAKGQSTRRGAGTWRTRVWSVRAHRWPRISSISSIHAPSIGAVCSTATSIF